MKLFVTFILFLSIVSSYSQTNSISGKITSEGENLPYVNVYLKKTTIGTVTNENGFFQIEKITNGTYTIVISSVGFKSKYEKITFSGGENIVQILIE